MRELIEVRAEFVDLRCWKKQRGMRIYLVGVGEDGFFVHEKLNRKYGLPRVPGFLEYMGPGEVKRAREDGQRRGDTARCSSRR